MARPFARTIALVLVLPAFGALAHAQNAFRPLPLPSDWGRWGAGLESKAGGSFESLDALAAEPDERTFVEARAHGLVTGSGSLEGGGDVATQAGGWSVTFGRELGEERLAAFSIETNGYFYDFGPGTALVPGSSQPFNDLYEARVSGLVRTEGDGLGWFAGLSATLGGEDEADASEALAVGGLGGFRWSRSPDTAVEFGIAAQSRLEDDAWLWPFLGFEWQATERLSFEARGTSVQANVDWNESWRTFARAEYLLRQFRLNDDSPLAQGVLRDETIRAGLGLERRGENVSFELFAGFDLWRELSTLASGGAGVAEAEVDSAPFLAFSLGFDF
ncbi:MAG: hypothetical protein L6Q99_02195 [Planctomycetes bacterium]|nr:hypothetical protein [Planctomycetota bacterium]